VATVERVTVKQIDGEFPAPTSYLGAFFHRLVEWLIAGRSSWRYPVVTFAKGERAA
jgi:hypothetical protein